MKNDNLLKSVGITTISLLGYAVMIEPFAIKLEKITLFCERLPSEFDNYKVLLLSDFHSRGVGLRERRVLDFVNGLPVHDMIALDGDILHTQRGMNDVCALVQQMKHRDGIYAVFGNSEHKNGVIPHVLAQKLQESGVTPLLNKHTRIYRNDQSIVIAGVDDPVTEHDDLAAAMNGVGPDEFVLLLMHTPDSIALASARGIDVVLSGHTHGGQIKLPVVGPLYTHSLLGTAMSNGLYRGNSLRKVLGFNPKRTQLYVTRGIGISGLAMRFMCRPEITSITLKRAPFAK